ncbi:DUF551 domain-containing protein [Escherichia coli]|nr:DUF551 domain-containing protein [Escherichia coli]EHP0989092.1 DUF551 domain-containing protein [Escherichia coli]
MESYSLTLDEACTYLIEPLYGGLFLPGEFTYLSGNILDDVTHWMPLPEPPQEAK